VTTVQSRRIWTPRADADTRRRSATRIAELIVADDGIIDSHRKVILSKAIWRYTEADGGNWGVQFWSSGALDMRARTGSYKGLNHEHVYTQKDLIRQMIAEPDRVAEIIASAVACIVTVGEHRCLGAAEHADPELRGWDRYDAAGIEVRDVSYEPPRQLQRVRT
jgi:hypothetical protein